MHDQCIQVPIGSVFMNHKMKKNLWHHGDKMKVKH